jgi:hypothetical protein
MRTRPPRAAPGSTSAATKSGAPTDLYRHFGIDVETIVGAVLDPC